MILPIFGTSLSLWMNLSKISIAIVVHMDERNGKGLEDELPFEANGGYTKSRRRSLINDTLAAHLFGNMLQEDDRIIKQVGRPGAKRLFVLAKFLPGGKPILS
ncbi:uncharacterized protein LOC117626255 isoform X2 [Prunus dulcis]|uniref:uncharacterized protein LOC117626255 isoform X2 n=1 Tax=Prunus dulcis TaxID=3755 RepID=UPI001482F391|nr:uncharacterized protein LOC117626255 isoform X2 [Prunus dulcis]